MKRMIAENVSVKIVFLLDVRSDFFTEEALFMNFN
jgi:hypothetical protein